MIRGGKHKKRGGGRRLKGGHSPSPLSPYPLTEGVNTLGTSSAPGSANFTTNPSKMGYNNMVGGSYGFDKAALAEVPSFAGSYFPVSRACTGSAPDHNARGGNNFSQGGGGGMRALTMSNYGGGGKGRRRHRNKKRTVKTSWWQRGCSTGGTKKRRSTKKRNGTKRRTHKKIRGGFIPL